MKRAFLLVLGFVFFVQAKAQTAGPKTLKQVLTLKMPLTRDDDMSGTRGAGVVWHPAHKKYYAAFAGNISYPLAIFDAKGVRLSGDNLKTQRDVRGLWYNSDTRQVQGNCYSDYGWFAYILDATALVTDYQVIVEGMSQPDGQSVGAFDSKRKQVLFLFEGKVHSYDSKTGEFISNINIHWGQEKAADENGQNTGGEDESYTPEDYNNTSLIYTGIAGAELGFLDVTEKQVELYDIATGYLTKTLSLPDEAPAELSFNFSYTNGIYWLFDMEARSWYGYK